jgi:D-2-hydroxyacid dehydrogenase (NADP+)
MKIKAVVGMYRSAGIEHQLLKDCGDYLREYCYSSTMAELERDIRDAELLILPGNRYTEEIAELLTGSAVRWIQSTGVGVNTYLDIGVPKGIILTNARGVYTSTIVEHVFALLLSDVRCIRQLLQCQNTNVWGHNHVLSDLRTLSGKHMVIYGFGEIGQAIGRMALNFGMLVTGVTHSGRHIQGDFQTVPAAEAHRFLPLADYLILTVPLTPSTINLVDEAFLAKLNQDCFLVNVSRGEVVDEQALEEALIHGRIRGAALDVFAEEPLPETSRLWKIPSLIISPHLSGLGGGREIENLNTIIRENLERFTTNRNLYNVVDLARGY